MLKHPTSAVRPAPNSPGRYTADILLVAAAVFLALLPLLTAHHLPLLDAPAHESRLMIVMHLLAGQPSHFYDLGTFLLPDIGFDVIGLGLVHVMPPEAAGKVFLALTLLLMLGGVMVLHRALWGRWGRTPLFTALLLYNLVTILGFLSYSFGMALALWAMALRLTLARSRPDWGLWAGAMSVVVLLFCHLFAVAIYVTVASGFVLTAFLRREIGLKMAIPRLLEPLPAASIYLSMPSLGLQRLRYQPSLLLSKVLSIAKAVSAASMTGDVALVLGAFCFLLLMLTARRVRLAADVIPGLAVLTLVYLVLPGKVGSGAYVDSRVPIVLMFLVLAGLRLDVPRTRRTQALVVGIVATFVVKQVAIAVMWTGFDPRLDALLSAVRALPSGSVVMELECEPESLTSIAGIYRSRQPSLSHVASLAALDRGIFLPTDFAIRGQQPISVVPAYQSYARFQARLPRPACDPALDRKVLQDARSLQATRRSSGLASPPLFLLLLRPAVPKALAKDAPLLAANKDFEVYTAAAAE